MKHNKKDPKLKTIKVYLELKKGNVIKAMQLAGLAFCRMRSYYNFL
ncbi:MAG: hypothetical protein NTV16_05250 [Actinobacteria bacterium]|nr:hypothetical protein [Actinomycetota bacterium]